MKNQIYLQTFLFLASITMIQAQATTLNIAISRDTVLLGNAFYVQYSYDMKDAQFIAPEIKGSEVIGQNFVSNTSIINGEIKVMHKQRYLIQPSETGEYTIPPTIVKSGASDTGGDLEIPAVQIYVKPNPKKMDQDPEEDKSWQFIDILKGKPTTKRKSKKL